MMNDPLRDTSSHDVGAYTRRTTWAIVWVFVAMVILSMVALSLVVAGRTWVVKHPHDLWRVKCGLYAAFVVEVILYGLMLVRIFRLHRDWWRRTGELLRRERQEEDTQDKES